MDKLEELVKAKKIQEFLSPAKEEKKGLSPIVWVAIVVAAVLVIAGIVYAVYRYFTPDYLEDFEDDIDDDFDDDFFDDEEDESASADKVEK